MRVTFLAFEVLLAAPPAVESPPARPAITLVAPADQSSTRDNPVPVTLRCAVPVTVSASSLVPSGTKLPAGDTTISATLSAGYNVFTTFVTDSAGGRTALSFGLFLDLEPPSLSFHGPRSGDSVPSSPANVLVSLSEDVMVVSATKGFLPPGPKSGGEDTLAIELKPGINILEASLRDAAGNERTYAGETAFRLDLVTAIPPAPVIAHPRPDARLDARIIEVRGTAGGVASAVLVSSSSSSAVVSVEEGTFSARIALAPGRSAIRAVALNRAGLRSPERAIAVTGPTGRDAYLPPSASTLSALRARDGRCEWVRLDPPDYDENVVASFQGLCRSARVLWSPDGSRGAIAAGTVVTDATSHLCWWSAWREPARKLFEVDLLSNTATPVDLTALGNVFVIAFDGYSRLTARSVDERARDRWIARRWRRTGGAWVKTVETSARSRHRIEWPEDGGNLSLGECEKPYFAFQDPLSARVLRELETLIGRPPDSRRNEEWKRVTPDSRFLFLYDHHGPPPDAAGTVALLGADGRVTALPGIPVGGRPRVAARERFLLTVDGRTARLHDDGGRLLWFRSDLEQVMLWPRFGRCGDAGFGWIDGGP